MLDVSDIIQASDVVETMVEFGGQQFRVSTTVNPFNSQEQGVILSSVRPSSHAGS